VAGRGQAQHPHVHDAGLKLVPGDHGAEHGQLGPDIAQLGGRIVGHVGASPIPARNRTIRLAAETRIAPGYPGQL